MTEKDIMVGEGTWDVSKKKKISGAAQLQCHEVASVFPADKPAAAEVPRK